MSRSRTIYSLTRSYSINQMCHYEEVQLDHLRMINTRNNHDICCLALPRPISSDAAKYAKGLFKVVIMITLGFIDRNGVVGVR